ncbi:MAG TPA: hypothetical protein VN943_01625 [Candidatus Acidoferrum sp.]|nr:hypothetical protein [Candidatus Acidoferrum sp.]
MKSLKLIAGPGIAALLAVGLPSLARAQGPVPVVAPIVVDTAVPIIVSAVKPKPKPGVAKFEGFVMHANIAQITVRAKGNDLAIRTFPLSEVAAGKMQKIVDQGGYQYGDKVTVLYDATTEKALKIKGKPSKAL